MCTRVKISFIRSVLQIRVITEDNIYEHFKPIDTNCCLNKSIVELSKFVINCASMEDYLPTTIFLM